MRQLYIAIVLVILIGCTKDKKISGSYPDCFQGVASSPNFINGVGCGNIIVTLQLDNNRLVSILLHEQALDLKTNCKSFKVENDTTDIDINYYTYANNPDSIYFNFCNDVLPMNYGRKITWKAVSGSVTAVVSRDRSERKDCEAYQTSIELSNIRFIKENSTQDTIIASIIIRDKTVGVCIP